jgi:tetratricopeptide (TPR) repeat protein
MQSPTELLQQATAATRRGDFAAGGAGASGALELFRARGDADGRARSVNLLGAIAFERGDLAAAEQHFGEALALAVRTGEATLAARASNNLASVRHLHGDLESALSTYRTALLSYQRLGDRRGMAETWHNVTLTFRDLGRAAEADAASAEALRHAELIGDAGLVALVMTGRAEAALLRADFDLAGRAIRRARELAAEAGDALTAAEADHLLARLLLRLGRLDEARTTALAAAAAARAHASALLAAEATGIAAVAARRLGRAGEAEGLYAEARAALDRLDARNFLSRLDAAWDVRPLPPPPHSPPPPSP